MYGVTIINNNIKLNKYKFSIHEVITTMAVTYRHWFKKKERF